MLIIQKNFSVTKILLIEIPAERNQIGEFVLFDVSIFGIPFQSYVYLSVILDTCNVISMETSKYGVEIT